MKSVNMKSETLPAVGSSDLFGDYPGNWKDIARRTKDASGWKCERCKEPHRVEGAFVLTVHHLDGNKANCADWNLAALCQRCHLKIQGRVKMGQMFFAEILDVSEWFKPHLEGFLHAKSPNDPSSATRPTRACDCNRDAMAGFAAAHG